MPEDYLTFVLTIKVCYTLGLVMEKNIAIQVHFPKYNYVASPWLQKWENMKKKQKAGEKSVELK